MYVITFYSFKGGVGRTQALVNVGVELARRGRRVLLVDFDLEAPGLDTYDLPRPPEPTGGMVEFITDYLATNRAPDASLYMYESVGVGERGGKLWVMPSGRQDTNYGRMLASIDWENLYANHEGYYLFEDLKAQWHRALAPDYVLIDSRTGHTDVSGICTRQLPDAVVIMFFPTDQNLRGLPKIVGDIRAEAESARRKRIHLEFVMSNVPDLDDEDQILGSRMKIFRAALGYRQLDVIHRYDSLALLNQIVFTSQRPKSRLAREYVELTSKLIESNYLDKDGATLFLERLSRPFPQRLTREEIEEKLEEIHRAHAHDGQVLTRLAHVRMRDGQIHKAVTLLDEAAAAGYSTPDLWLTRAECKSQLADTRDVASDLDAVLTSTDAQDFHVSRAVRLLKEIDPDALRTIASRPAVRALDRHSREWLARQLAEDASGLAAARNVLLDLANEPGDDPAETARVAHLLTLTLIGLHEFERAIEVIDAQKGEWYPVPDAFNKAIAVWGKEGVPPHDMFARIVELAEAEPVRDLDSPNYANFHQCIALAAAVLNDRDKVERHLADARQGAITLPVSALFSCWTYTNVDTREFLGHLQQINRFAQGEPVVPPAVTSGVHA